MTIELARAEAIIRDQTQELRQLHELCEGQRVTIRELKATLAGIRATLTGAKAEAAKSADALCNVEISIDTALAQAGVVA
jgi:hypothetical protein